MTRRTGLLLGLAVVAAVALAVSRTSSPQPPPVLRIVHRQFPAPVAPAPSPPNADTETVCAPKLNAVSDTSTPRLALVDSAITLRLPARMTEALEACEPGFHPYSLKDYGPYGRGLGFPHDTTEMLSAVVGDFDGDSMMDVFAIGRTERYSLNLAVLSNRGRYEVHVLLRSPAADFHGQLGEVLTLVRPGPVVGLDGDTVHLRTDAVSMDEEEKVDALCYYRNGHFIWVSTGD